MLIFSFTGDLVARMTVGNGHHLYPSVNHLLHVGVFTHVHWQLDVLWDSPIFARWDNFLEWRDNDYNPAITKLTAEFIDAVEKEGKVLGIVPILGILWSYLNNEKITHIRCSSGYKVISSFFVHITSLSFQPIVFHFHPFVYATYSKSLSSPTETCSI